MISTEERLGRQAFTLIELLVVIAIITLVAALGYAFFPSMSSRTLTDAADRIQGWLLIAKQQAKRDNRATGIRFLVSGTTVPPRYVYELQYIQQPDNFIEGTCHNTAAAPTVVNFTFPAGVTLLGSGTKAQANAADDVASVQPGDYIEFDHSGAVYPISTINNATQVALGYPPGAVTTPPQQALTVPAYTSAVPYRIIRMPRRISGEDNLILPNNTADQTTINPDVAAVIDTTQYNPTANPKVLHGCWNLPPVRTMIIDSSVTPAKAISCYDIVFSPSGAVVGPGAAKSMIGLWLCTQNNTSPPVVVAIHTRTGLIGVYPVNQNTPGQEYSFAQDGRASGM